MSDAPRVVVLLDEDSLGSDARWEASRDAAAALVDGGERVVMVCPPALAERLEAFLAAGIGGVLARDPRDLLAAAAGERGEVAPAPPVAAAVLVVAGGVAAGADGEPVPLTAGPGMSAALLASAFQAVRVERWGERPGLYSADPRRVPAARLLRALDYEEAQELCTMGDGGLHPAVLGLLKRLGVPLRFRSLDPPRVGTVVEARAASAEGRLKAVAVRAGVTLVAMETVGMWHQVGFLASIFERFARHGISVDLVATSETSVTVSLDAVPTGASLHALLRDLGDLCLPHAIAPCAAISLVGRHIRSILHRLGPVLELFEEEHVHLVSQAANDLNLTFVVDEDQADKLLTRLHALLLRELGEDDAFGPEREAAESSEDAPWWRRRRGDLLALAAEGTPLYVYDEETLRGAVASLQGMDSVDRVFYAVKANPHEAILRLFHWLGLSFECVSPGELRHLREVLPGLEGGRVLYTPNFASDADYRAGFEAGAYVTLDNLDPLETWPDLFRGRRVLLRLDPGEGGGHHRHVRTAGPRSKFGISEDQLDRLQSLLAGLDVTVIGLHAHVGSGIRDPLRWARTAGFLAQVVPRFPEARILDLGGGLGVPEKSGDPALDVAAVDENVAAFRAAHPGFEVWLEPGRFLVAQSGALLARVTQRKRKGSKAFVGVDTGMNTLIRPALYGAYHEIVNLTRLDEPPSQVADVVGPICETGDVLGHDRHLPECLPGDVLLVATVGAYGRAMSSFYNLRPPAAERVLALP